MSSGTKLEPFLDDFFVSSFCDRAPEFKWIHGDVMILDWYEKNGARLDWDSIAIVQWDMLVFDSIKSIFPDIKKDQIFLSGLRRIDSELENRWYWTSPANIKESKDYHSFKEYVRTEYNYEADTLPCCLFIFQILPRVFFISWLNVSNKYLGMLEYKIPTYAEIFSIDTYNKDVGVLWSDRKEDIRKLPMNAIPEEIEEAYIREELSKKNGYRMFHPYFKTWKQ